VPQVRSWGYDPLVVSCEGSGRGLQEVMSVLEGKTGVVAGPSGACDFTVCAFLGKGKRTP
jgi:putative ribosome biogenesis GTPase RsgA